MGAENGVPVWRMTGAKGMYTLGERYTLVQPRCLRHGGWQPGLRTQRCWRSFGLDPRTMPMKPMSVEQCVSEGLSVWQKTDPESFQAGSPHIERLVPASLARKMEADLLGKGLANKSAPETHGRGLFKYGRLVSRIRCGRREDLLLSDVLSAIRMLLSDPICRATTLAASPKTMGADQ